MRAFHGDLKIKEKYVNRVLAHFEADEIIKGEYWENGRGCAIGCTIHASSHLLYESKLGIPRWMAAVEDRIFEGLPNERAQVFPSEFLNSIHVGADLEKIKAPFLIFVLESTLDKFDHEKYPRIKAHIDNVIALYKNPESSLEDFTAYIASAAYAAAADAAYPAAAYPAAASSAYAAASAAVYAAAAAADAAYAAAAYYDVLENAYAKFADKLIGLLSKEKP